ncbi:hypothetical protein CYLTODRAFT_436017 [Cylindrobasidium torrendii FP15055 ss-10]|uniref:C3H1-type domain-containing protein n=1 Tax=Cylindrobasidium torrendii FP15055 ss-10 TaxID=1314674 RepID=A0A0D7BGL8_9AGAR|nr:hypothetical protein CYLTODRAFT_436017 [Cylindrobasidium torrendii FP15055 ss-10]
MLFDPANSQHLKPWLVKTLEPICDAEPSALGEYILALLKHNVSEQEMRKELTSQLDEFLEKECAPFLDSLFKALRSQSYLPYSTETPSASTTGDGIPIPIEAYLPPSIPTSPRRKRGLEDDGGHRPSKGPRLSEDGNFARFPGGGDATNGYGGMGYSDGRQGYQPPPARRGICRDYHNFGYCSRGATCKYNHGDDAMVPGQMFPMNGVNMGQYMPPYVGQGAPGGSGGAYDPRDSSMDLRGQANGRGMRPAMMPRDHRLQASGELPVIQDLTPSVPVAHVQPHPHARPQPAAVSEDIDMAPPRPGYQHIPNHRGGRPAGRGRGTFGDMPGIARPERRRDKTLVVEKIPPEKLTLEHVNNWFKRFGTVTNVAIDKHQAKALVSFGEHEAAQAAWKSEDAVFGNRFVKVFWHRPMEGHGQKGAQMLAASAAVIGVNTSTPTSAQSTPPPSTTARKPAPAVGGLAAKQKQLEDSIAEQKELMGKLSTATPEEKKSIMIRLKELMSAPPVPAVDGERKNKEGDAERKKREALDKELDMHSSMNTDGDGESAEDLKAKLERLKAEAASLGISPEGEGAPQSGGWRGAYRGRSRGRGFFRGAARGGLPQRSMKLDNRPKQLIVKSISGDGLVPLREWFEPGGLVDSVTETDDGDAVVSFKTRAAAEQALAKGTDIPGIGSVKISWHASTQSTGGSEPSTKSPSSTSRGKPDVDDDMEPSSPPRPVEDEPVSSGWGEDNDDGMGMA